MIRTRSSRPYLAPCALMLLLLLGTWQGAFGFIIDANVTPWTTTASGRRLGNGQAGTLTWSIVPDGTSVSDGTRTLGDSDLISYFNRTFSGDPDEADHRQQPWFPIVESAFDRWAELSGLTFVYEPQDDGGRQNTRPGRLDVRGDIRLSGTSVDGNGNTLAFNFLPEFGGDMTLDTDEVGFGNDNQDYRFLRNTIMHELGHAFGLNHVTSSSHRLLMEPFTDTAIDGPQLDEVRGVQYFFGDAFEAENAGQGNNQPTHATELGVLRDGEALGVGLDADQRSQRVFAGESDFVSISNEDDEDYYAISIPVTSALSLELTPLGGIFSQAGEFGRPESFDASARSDLVLSLFDATGEQLLAEANEGPAGESELLTDIVLPAGTYLTRVQGLTADSIQLYMLEWNAEEMPADCNADGLVDAADLNCACASGIDDVRMALNIPPGDTNADGLVDFADFLTLSANFGEGTRYAEGNFDCRDVVDFGDFLILANEFGTQAPASVPEPSALGWSLVGLGWLGTRRKRLGLRLR